MCRGTVGRTTAGGARAYCEGEGDGWRRKDGLRVVATTSALRACGRGKVRRVDMCRGTVGRTTAGGACAYCEGEGEGDGWRRKDGCEGEGEGWRRKDGVRA
jgi:hypothetical protein